ncbi:MAG: hypothetical protein V1875_09885 [Candidatus Altiarchaeota archaeon]
MGRLTGVISKAKYDEKRMMMDNKAKITLLLLAFSFMCPLAGAVEITSIKISEDPVSYLGKFDVTARLSGLSGTECNLIAEFYVDDFRFDTLNIPCGANEIEGRFDLSADDWVAKNVQCGVRQARVELHRPIGNALVTNKTVEINIGNVPNVELNPSQPTAEKEVRVILTDKDTGDPLQGVDVRVKDIYGGEDISRRTIQDGSFMFTPKVAGEYHLTMSNRLICGEMVIYAKRPLMIDGPRPDNPVINEMVMVAVPSGASVGVKILDAKGNLFRIVPVTFNGGANFSISQPGTYTLVVGDQSTKYWPLNRTFVVSDRLIPEVKIAPEQPVVGKTATITVTSRGEPLSGAVVTVKRPDGVDRDYTTSDYGTINYENVPSTGTYPMKVTKDRFGVGSASFEAKHALNVKFEPLSPTVKDTITIIVNDQNDKPVSDVLVEIPDTGFKRITDMAGKVSFNLQEAREYRIKLTKDLFWDYTAQLTPYGLLTFGQCLSEFELGNSVELKVFDTFNNPASAELTVRDPDGIIKPYSGSSQTLTPDKPGQYLVTASKTNYINSNLTFTVTPHPLDINTTMAKGQLTVQVKSKGQPVSQMAVSVIKGQETFNGTTNEAGAAVFSINREGNVSITANLGKLNRNYGELTVRQIIVRSYDLILLTTPLIIIFAITLMTIIAIQLGRMYLGSEWKMPSFGSGGVGSHKGRTKHDSTLLGDKKPHKSRLSKM